jgi:hypothetical protein
VCHGHVDEGARDTPRWQGCRRALTMSVQPGYFVATVAPPQMPRRWQSPICGLLWMAAKTWIMSMDLHKKKVHEPSCEVRINLKTYSAIHYKLKYVKLEKH